MKKFLAALLLCSASAFATPLTYSTHGVFSGPDLSGGNLVNGGATISFTDNPTTSVTAPTNINIGTVNVVGGIGTFSGDTFMLTITQTVPTPGGSNTSSTTVAGSVTSTSNGIDLTFSPTSFSIASNPAVQYILQSNYFLVAPNTNNGQTTLQAFATATPEPASLGLMGASLLGLGLLVRRRAKK